MPPIPIFRHFFGLRKRTTVNAILELVHLKSSWSFPFLDVIFILKKLIAFVSSFLWAKVTYYVSPKHQFLKFFVFFSCHLRCNVTSSYLMYILDIFTFE